MYIHAPTDSYYEESILIASATKILSKEYALAKVIKILHPRRFINSIFLEFLLEKSSIS